MFHPYLPATAATDRDKRQPRGNLRQMAGDAKDCCQTQLQQDIPTTQDRETESKEDAVTAGPTQLQTPIPQAWKVFDD